MSTMILQREARQRGNVMVGWEKDFLASILPLQGYKQYYKL